MIKLRISKKNLLILSLILLTFSAASVFNIRDPQTNVYSVMGIDGDLKIGAGEGRLKISDEGSEPDLIPYDSGYQEDQSLRFDSSSNNWTSGELKKNGNEVVSEPWVKSVVPASAFTGTGRNGDVVNSAPSLVEAETYRIEPGVTATGGNQVVVFAKEEIIIDGTLDVEGEGADGGEGANNEESDSPENGEDADLSANSAGGGRDYTDTQIENFDFFFSGSWDPVFNKNIVGGAGGKGGNNGGMDGDYSSLGRPAGGTGGSGGGTVVLVAPRIKITGEVTAAGSPGGAGEDGYCSYDQAFHGGEGGNGGAGGAIILATAKLDNSGTIDVSGGVGGDGGEGGCDSGNDFYTSNDGSNGVDGSDGFIKMIDLSQ